MTHSFVQKSPKPSHSIQKKKNQGLSMVHQALYTLDLCYSSGPYAINSSYSSLVPFPLTPQVSPSLEVWHALCLKCFSSGYLQDEAPVVLGLYSNVTFLVGAFSDTLPKKKKCNTHTLSPSPLSLHFTLNTYYHLINCLFYVSCLYFLSLHDRKWSPVREVIAFCLDQLSSALKKHLAYDKSSGFVK